MIRSITLTSSHVGIEIKTMLIFLRKVATSDNLLTFERFCAGLKICLLRSQGQRQDTSESNVSSSLNLC